MIPDKMVWGAIGGLLLSQMFGALWYSPYLFGNPWMRRTFPGKSAAQIGQGFTSAFTFAIVSCATLALLMQFILVNFLKVTSIEVAVKTALGLAALSTLLDIPHLFFSKRNIVAFLIDHGYDAGVLVITSTLIMYFS